MECSNKSRNLMIDTMPQSSTVKESISESLSSEFEVIGCSYQYGEPIGFHYDGTGYNVSVNGKDIYKRLFIKRKANQ